MDYKFSTASKFCMLCKHEFNELEFFMSALRSTVSENSNKQTDADNEQNENDGQTDYQRVDSCLECWEKEKQEKYFSWWQMQKAPKKKLPALKDLEFLWQLFYQAKSILDEVDAVQDSTKIEEAENFAYVSALGLMRMRQLKMASYENEDETEFLVFTQTGTKNKLKVKDPKINPETLAKLEEKLEKLSAERFET
ncbi:MAG: hypothetical protein K8S87_06960 [Planctomycetes bacterium]|nr:hypothetical protein [Planctomycetota bacterium]